MMKWVRENVSLKQKLRQHKEPLITLALVAVYVAIAYTFSWKCPVAWITGISCPGCGITRALVSVCSLDLSSAWYYNPAIFYLIPAVPVFLIAYLRKSVRLQDVMIWITAGMIIAVFLLRLLIFRSPVLEVDPANGLIGQWIRLLMGLF